MVNNLGLQPLVYLDYLCDLDKVTHLYQIYFLSRSKDKEMRPPWKAPARCLHTAGAHEAAAGFESLPVSSPMK